MKKCIAFRGVPGVPNAWVRCARAAQSGSLFCRQHGEAINGAVLGMQMAGMLDEYEPWQHRKKPAEAAKTAPEKVM
jgi:hypothetical protein